MKMSSYSKSTSKAKFSSTGGFNINKDRESNNKEKRFVGNSPVTNIVYFNYNSRGNDYIGSENKLQPNENYNEASAVYNLNPIQPSNQTRKHNSGFNSTDSKIFQLAQTKSARVLNERFLSHIDMERLRDEIMKVKVENSKIKKDQIEIKAENKRLEEDYKKSVKILEEVLKEGGSAAHEVLNSIIRKIDHHPNRDEENLNENDKSFDTEENNLNKVRFNLSGNTFFRLKEMFMINSLKSQIIELKQVNKRQEEDIENYKNNSRVSRLHKLEQDFLNTSNELALLKGEYENVRLQYEGALEKYKENLEEKNYFKLMMQKYKAQFEDSKANLKNSKDETFKLKEMRKSQDEKIVYLSKIARPSNSNMILWKNKDHDNQRDTQVLIEKNELTSLEFKAKEYEKMEIKVKALSKEKGELVERLEKKKQKILTLEHTTEKVKEIADITVQLDNFRSEKENLKRENLKTRNEIENSKKEFIIEKENYIKDKNKLDEDMKRIGNFISEKDNLVIEIEKLKTQNNSLGEELKLKNNYENLRNMSQKENEILKSKKTLLCHFKKKIIVELENNKKALNKNSEEIKILNEKYASLENEKRSFEILLLENINSQNAKKKEKNPEIEKIHSNRKSNTVIEQIQEKESLFEVEKIQINEKPNIDLEVEKIPDKFQAKENKKIEVKAEKVDDRFQARLDEKIDVKIETIHEKVHAKLDEKIDVKVETIHEKIHAKLDVKVETIHEKIHAKLDEKIDGQAEKVHAKLNEKIDEKIDGQAEKVHAKLDEKIDGQAEKVHAKLDEKIDGQAEKIDAKLDEKIDVKVETIHAKLEEKIDGQPEKMYEKVPSKLEEKIDGQPEKMYEKVPAKLDEKIDGQPEKIHEKFDGQAEKVHARLDDKIDWQEEKVHSKENEKIEQAHYKLDSEKSKKDDLEIEKVHLKIEQVLNPEKNHEEIENKIIHEIKNIKNKVKFDEIPKIKNEQNNEQLLEKENTEKNDSEILLPKSMENEKKEGSLVISPPRKVNLDINKGRHNSAILTSSDIKDTEKIPAPKRNSLKNRLHDLIFENGKIFTLKNTETNKKIQYAPAYVQPISEVIETSDNYTINVEISEVQHLNPSNSYFVLDPEAEMKKSKEKAVIRKAMMRMKTIEKVIFEKITNEEDFEKMLDDPQNLFLKLK